MLKKLGRPLKYALLLANLPEEALYSPHTIAVYATTSGYIKHENENGLIEQRRIRISCNHLRRQYEFPLEGDGSIKIAGQHPKIGWFGWRWRKIVEEKTKKAKQGRSRKRRKRRGHRDNTGKGFL